MKDCNEIADCSGRREFLVKAAFLAGGLVLTLSGAGSVIGKPFEDIVVPIDDKSPLSKVGGSTVIPSAAGKIIIVRKGETDFVAFSAKCTHFGTTVNYDDAKKMFTCPNHGSQFNSTTGVVVKGPADDPLASYKAKGTATSVTVTIGT